MNKNEIDKDVFGVIFKEIDREEKLKEIVHQPKYRYYFKNARFAFITCIAFNVFLIWGIFNSQINFYILVVIGTYTLAFLESNRQKKRFNALRELLEIEKRKQIK